MQDNLSCCLFIVLYSYDEKNFINSSLGQCTVQYITQSKTKAENSCRQQNYKSRLKVNWIRVGGFSVLYRTSCCR